MLIKPRAITVVGAIFLTISAKLALGAETGYWKVESKDRGTSLEFKQKDRTIFYVGIGRAYAIWLAYPDPGRHEENITVRISDGKSEWELAGAISEKSAFAGSGVAYFYQWDMGLPRPAFLDSPNENESNSVDIAFRRFFDFIVNAENLIILTDSGEIELPRVSVEEAELCKNFRTWYTCRSTSTKPGQN
jgi:hypothetical protein